MTDAQTAAGSAMGPDDDTLLQYLLVAWLSVAGWGLERVWPLRGVLVREGFLDFVLVASLSEEEVAKRLQVAGYRRGVFMTNLLATRLRAGAARIVAIGMEEVLRVLRSGTLADLSGLRLPGVGPTIAGYFVTLRDGR